jgi:hypothetical protein
MLHVKGIEATESQCVSPAPSSFSRQQQYDLTAANFDTVIGKLFRDDVWSIFAKLTYSCPVLQSMEELCFLNPEDISSVFW